MKKITGAILIAAAPMFSIASSVNGRVSGEYLGVVLFAYGTFMVLFSEEGKS